MPGFGNELLIIRGPTGITDQSGFGNHGTYQGGMGTVADTDRGGTTAFLLDSTNDFISFASAIVTTMPVTLAAWIKPTSVGISQAVISLARSDGTLHFRNLRLDNITIHAASAAGASSPSGSIAGVAANTWHLVIGEFLSATSRTAFLDGTTGTTSATSRAPTALNELLIGFNRSTGFGYFGGRMDDIRVLDRVLTAAEISAWVTAGRMYDVGGSTQRRRSAQASIQGAF